MWGLCATSEETLPSREEQRLLSLTIKYTINFLLKYQIATKVIIYTISSSVVNTFRRFYFEKKARALNSELESPNLLTRVKHYRFCENSDSLALWGFNEVIHTQNVAQRNGLHIVYTQYMWVLIRTIIIKEPNKWSNCHTHIQLQDWSAHVQPYRKDQNYLHTLIGQWRLTFSVQKLSINIKTGASSFLNDSNIRSILQERWMPYLELPPSIYAL